MDGQRPDHEARSQGPTDLRVRLSRGELRDDRSAERRPRRRAGQRVALEACAARERQFPGERMRVRIAVSVLVIAAAAVAVSLMFSRPARIEAQGNADRPARRADGKPDLSGIWQALNTANWDLQTHAARPALAVTPGPDGDVPAAPVLMLGGLAECPEA